MVVLVVLVTLLRFFCRDKDFHVDIDSGGFRVVLGLVGFTCIRFFMVRSFFSFYFFFESSLIPTLFLILGWGYQPERLQAGFFIILYTVRASIPLFIRLCWIVVGVGRDNIIEVMQSGGRSVSSLI